MHFATTLEAVETGLAQGLDVNGASFLGYTPLELAYQNGRDDVMRWLYERGADVEAIGWTALHIAVQWGGVKDVKDALLDPHILRLDCRGQTTLDLAIARGDGDILKALLPELPAGVAAPLLDKALIDTAWTGNPDFVQALIDCGAALEVEDAWDESALSQAANWGEADVVAVLLKAGASVESVTRFDPNYATINEGYDKVAKLLMANGWTPDMLADENRTRIRHFTRATLIPEQTISAEEFLQTCGARFGNANPEHTTLPAYLEMIRTGDWPEKALERLGGGGDTPFKMFCFDRFGQSTTQLPDGRWVQIAGEHEDFYDPNFCIYNDVVVHDGAGGCDIYLYPEDIFPPTDFHSATLIDERILIVGNLGYQGQRKVGETQVRWLNLTDFSITPVQTHGQLPGWISDHRAVLSDNILTVSGGNVQLSNGLVPLEGIYALNFATMFWTRTA